MTQIQCNYCFAYPHTKFFSTYVLHILTDDDILPIFCGAYCMCNWVAIKKDISFVDAMVEYTNFCNKKVVVDSPKDSDGNEISPHAWLRDGDKVQ